MSRFSRKTALPPSPPRPPACVQTLVAGALPKLYVGVDIGKKHLDYACLQTIGRVPNTTEGHAKLRTLIATHPHAQSATAHFICEATGGYQDRFVESCHAHSLTISVINPRQVRDFARSRNLLAKTDKLDAAVCEQYGVANGPPAHQAPSASQVKLVRMMSQLDHLIACRAEEKTRAHELREDLVKQQVARIIGHYDTEIQLLEKALRQHRDDDAQLLAHANRVDELAGFDWCGALRLLAYLPELGHLSSEAAAKMAGVAPLNYDSGQMRGQRHIAGGRAPVRRQLYLSALSAIQHNAIFKSTYAHLKGQGKPSKVALVAVMRKMLVVLNAALKDPKIALQSRVTRSPRKEPQKAKKPTPAQATAE